MAKAKSKMGAAPQAPHNVKLPEGFTTKRQVILPVLSLQVDQPRIVKFLEAMRISAVKASPESAARAKAEGKGDQKEKPATVAPVVDMQTGENLTLIVPAVLEANLKEQYPDDGYVGKGFYVMKKAKRPGKRYFDFEISEVEKA